MTHVWHYGLIYFSKVCNYKILFKLNSVSGIIHSSCLKKLIDKFILKQKWNVIWLLACWKILKTKSVKTLVGLIDDDTTTMARARKEVKASVRKKSDANHAKKHFTNKLCSLQKAKKYRQLGTKTISHFKKCFNNIIAMN